MLLIKIFFSAALWAKLIICASSSGIKSSDGYPLLLQTLLPEHPYVGLDLKGNALPTDLAKRIHHYHLKEYHNQATFNRLISDLKVRLPFLEVIIDDEYINHLRTNFGTERYSATVMNPVLPMLNIETGFPRLPNVMVYFKNSTSRDSAIQLVQEYQRSRKYNKIEIDKLISRIRSLDSEVTVEYDQEKILKELQAAKEGPLNVKEIYSEKPKFRSSNQEDSGLSMFFLETLLPQIPYIEIDLKGKSLPKSLITRIYHYHREEEHNQANLNRLLNIIRNQIPESEINYDQEYITNKMNGKKQIRLNPPHKSENCQALVFKKVKSIAEWKKICSDICCVHIRIDISRSRIVESAIESYKNSLKMPEISRQNLNLNVVYDGGSVPTNILGARDEFFKLFFTEIVEQSGLFHSNKFGYFKCSPRRTSPSDLDAYEAFGFYLAKAFQNGYSVGYHFSGLIYEMIKFGKVYITKNQSYDNWGLESYSFLKMLRNFDDEALSRYNFSSIDKDLDIPVTRANVEDFISQKLKHNILYNLMESEVPLIMIAFGFIQACPAHLIKSYSADMDAEIFGDSSVKKTRTANIVIYRDDKIVIS